MQLLSEPAHDQLEPCPYLPDRQKRYLYFYALEVDAAELDELLRSGWRKFGPYFFRPDCPGCRNCIPLRVPVAAFVPSRSQRRVLRVNRDVEVSFGPLQLTEEVYRIYRQHSSGRFAQQTSLEEFATSFFLPSCPALQSELHLAGEQIGVGFLDHAADGLSSVYFSFDPHYARRSPGVFSVLQEIDQARRLELAYYYLGYYVPGSPRMAYKDGFRPREYLDWASDLWRPAPD